MILEKGKTKKASSISQLQVDQYKEEALYKDLSEAHVILLHIVFKLGHSLIQVKQGLMLILEKKKGCILVDKLR